MSALDILEAAAGHMKDRAATYDKPAGERSMGATVAAFKAITGISMTEEQGWLFMGVLKQVRTQQGGWRADNYEDGAAYFALQGEAAARDRGNADPQRHPMTPNVLEFDEARADAIGQNGNDGEHYGQDMTDPRNWRAGDWVERSTVGVLWTAGKLYRIGDDGFILDDTGARCQVIVRDFRFHARPDADGWIKWEGGECPVRKGEKLEVKYRNGVEVEDVSNYWNWNHSGDAEDIIAYRPHLATKQDKG